MQFVHVCNGKKPECRLDTCPITNNLGWIPADELRREAHPEECQNDGKFFCYFVNEEVTVAWFIEQ